MIKRPDDSLPALAHGLFNAIEAMKQLTTQLHDNASAVGHLEEKTISLEANVSKLYMIMFEGDGKPSVAAQFVELSAEVMSLKKDLNQLMTIAQDMRRERIRSWTAIVVALIAAVGVVAGAVLR